MLVYTIHTNSLFQAFCHFPPLNTSILGEDSNLVDFSFEYLSFSNKRKTTILFPSPLTCLQWPIRQDHNCCHGNGTTGAILLRSFVMHISGAKFKGTLLYLTHPPLVQSLNSPFFPPHIEAEPRRAKEESKITCMRMLRTKEKKKHISKPVDIMSIPSQTEVIKITVFQKGCPTEI